MSFHRKRQGSWTDESHIGDLPKFFQSFPKFTKVHKNSHNALDPPKKHLANPLPGVFESKSFVTLFKCKTFYSEVPLLNKKQPRNAIPVISHSRCLLLMRAIWGHFAEDLDDLSLYVLLFVLQMCTGFKWKIELPASPNWTPYWAPFREQFAWRKVGWKVEWDSQWSSEWSYGVITMPGIRHSSNYFRLFVKRRSFKHSKSLKV